MMILRKSSKLPAKTPILQSIWPLLTTLHSSRIPTSSTGCPNRTLRCKEVARARSAPPWSEIETTGMLLCKRIWMSRLCSSSNSISRWAGQMWWATWRIKWTRKMITWSDTSWIPTALLWTRYEAWNIEARLKYFVVKINLLYTVFHTKLKIITIKNLINHHYFTL